MTKGQVISRSPQADREVCRNSPVRQARTCYDHLAGVAGVKLMDAMLQRGWLEVSGQSGARTGYQFTPAGEQALTNRGVDLRRASKSRRMHAYGCVDWTERRFHLGGALAAGILDALGNAGVIRCESGTRAVTLLKPIAGWLDSSSG
jgi:hypothetical protein